MTAPSEITRLNDALHRKNVQLDALHFVWCDGGCASGVHRYDHGELTEEIVVEAERNARRLRAWWSNAAFKKQWATWTPEQREAWFADARSEGHE